ncbi:MAG TPA: polymer-forming cytoskeletal protein [Candidatus Limnocylindrales bacterium]|nr:polymer-forming cytoskeletal protein [Candidatus Limnocylindrales bacterium]
MTEPDMNRDKSPDETHVDEMTLLLYAERQLDREAAQSVSLHTQTCTRCLTLLRALDRESRLLTRSMLEQDEPLPARLTEFHEKVKRSMQWIWGLVFGLAVLGVYALYTGYIEPWEHQFEQAGFGSTNLLNLVVFQGAFWKGWQSMFSLFEVLAVMCMAGFGLFAFRRYLRRGSALAVLFAGFGVLLAVGTPASATEFRKGDNVNVKKDEVIKGDIFLTGEHVRIDGEVDGDVYAFAHQVDVTGHVNGDLICFAQSVRMNGTIDGNLRALANNVTLAGSVDRNVTLWNETFNMDSSGKIGRSLTAGGETLTLDGKIGRDFLGFAGTTTISGLIGGSVRERGKSLSIVSGAEIDGKTSFTGPKEPSVASDAKLASPLEFTMAEHHRKDRDAGYYLWRVILTGTIILFGLVLAGLMPKFAVDTVESAGQIGASFGLGVLVFFGVFIGSIIACFTIVGLLVGASAFMLWLVMMFAAVVVVGGIVGQWIMGRDDDFWPFFLRVVVGIAIIRVVTSVPFIGTWVWLIVTLWGMGAISLAIYRRLQPTLAPNIPPAPMPPLSNPLPPNTTVGGI